MLVHHPDAGADRVTRRVERDRVPVEDDLALVRPVQAVEHVHQGRLAGAVLAQERMDFSPTEIEVDRVVGHDPGEALRDASQLEDDPIGLSHRGHPIRLGLDVSIGPDRNAQGSGTRPDP